ncbi:LysM peptidoglycan-binding domain-containing protein [Bacillus sp. T33-2]|uniref:LysM peptidoglycan-binding domain-containing protein n=1 Tax=Bacillus sp. T33-2 TaxID=2054168 RepID=UPI000C793C36|nr:LysM peptidoglycan-binding domain-containing protein [Bacillus sp. T33-2]PLR91133.1 chitinase [Bacillus sp. T33-2]
MAVHVVKRGDSLWAISRRFGVSISMIAEVNGLQSASSIVPGLSLYIPDNLLQSRYYSINAGDTLWQLARRFITSVPAILTANPGIDPNRLSIGQRIVIPSPVKMEIATLGFVIPSSPQAVLGELGRLAEHLTYVAVVAYTFTDEGYAYVELEDRAIVDRSKQLDIIPLLMIRNYRNGNFSPELVGKVLENPNYRRNLALSIANLARQRGYEGVSIDFEFIPPAQRSDFITFLQELKLALGALILHVNVHAKTEDIPTNPIIGAYDYRAIGDVSDIVAVMTIDYGYPGGPPDPIAPVWWVEQIIRYAVTQITRNKLQIAFPLYGYDKTVRTNLTRALSVQAAQNLAISIGVDIQFDARAQSPWYRYWRGSEEHVVWFEDIRSFIEKYRLIDIYQIYGTTYWQLNLAAPQNWAYVADNINAMKVRN